MRAQNNEFVFKFLFFFINKRKQNKQKSKVDTTCEKLKKK